MLKLAKDIISNNPIALKIFSKNFFEFSIYHQVLGSKAIFILILLLNYYSAKKQVGKNDLFGPVSPNNFEIIFIILEKTVAIKM